MSVIHLLLESRHWYDIAYILLDEIHNPRALTLLILEYILYLRAIEHDDCARVKVLLVSATLMSPIIAAIRDRLAEAGLRQGEYIVPHPDSGQISFLWDGSGKGVCEKPVNWNKIPSVTVKACLATPLMIDWLRRVKWQSSQILFIVAGSREMDLMRIALLQASARRKASWLIHCVSARSPRRELERVRNILKQQLFSYTTPDRLLVMTAGICKDSVTLHINGVINR